MISTTGCWPARSASGSRRGLRAWKKACTRRSTTVSIQPRRWTRGLSPAPMVSPGSPSPPVPKHSTMPDSTPTRSTRLPPAWCTAHRWAATSPSLERNINWSATASTQPIARPRSRSGRTWPRPRSALHTDCTDRRSRSRPPARRRSTHSTPQRSTCVPAWPTSSSSVRPKVATPPTTVTISCLRSWRANGPMA